MLHDHDYMNVIITGMGYEYGHIDYNSITKSNPEVKGKVISDEHLKKQ